MSSIDYEKAIVVPDKNTIILKCTLCDKPLITSVKEDLNYLNVLWENHVERECESLLGEL